MLPALDIAKPSLADVLESAFAAVRATRSGEAPGRIALPPVRKALVVLVDGLGAANLSARAGHARRIAARFGPRAVIQAGFPTTTAASIASLATGAMPGQHGILGYTVYDRGTDRVIPQLSGLDAVDIPSWQPVPTVFERAGEVGVDAVSIGPERYAETGFTRAVLRGARYLPARSISDRVERAGEWLRESGSGVGYLYVPELDMAGHAHGWQSSEWTQRLEELDGALEPFERLARDVGVLLTADHGMIDVPEHGHVQWDAVPALTDAVRATAGDPRALHVHAEAGHGNAVLDRWRVHEGERSWVVSREEAISAGWFGPVGAGARERIGDVVVAARKSVAYWSAADAGPEGMTMIGQHGSWSPGELRVPLLRFGAFS
jgi:hypothetical protein